MKGLSCSIFCSLEINKSKNGQNLLFLLEFLSYLIVDSDFHWAPCGNGESLIHPRVRTSACPGVLLRILLWVWSHLLLGSTLRQKWVSRRCGHLMLMLAASLRERLVLTTIVMMALKVPWGGFCRHWMDGGHRIGDAILRAYSVNWLELMWLRLRSCNLDLLWRVTLGGLNS